MKRSLLVVGLVGTIVLSAAGAMALTGHSGTPAKPDPAATQVGNLVLDPGQSEAHKPSFATDNPSVTGVTGLDRAQDVLEVLQTLHPQADGLATALDKIAASLSVHLTGQGHATQEGHGRP